MGGKLGPLFTTKRSGVCIGEELPKPVYSFFACKGRRQQKEIHCKGGRGSQKAHSYFLTISQAAGGSNIGQRHSGVYQKWLCILLLPTSRAIFQITYSINTA